MIFTYDYSLCKKLPNAVDQNTGKLTLKKIQIRYGTSNLNLSAAYSFNYSNLNPDYDIAGKDRWGFYKPNDSVVKNNFEFPYTDQAPGLADSYASAWALTDIKLPSGGAIKIDYEADDYAYVQDKDAREMFMVAGMGNSPNYDGGANELYFNPSQPNLYFYFKRRKDAENPQLSFKDNYMRDTSLMYYNIPVELKAGLYEPIKGYATVTDIGICDNTDYGYVKLAAKGMEGTSYMANPVTYAALNMGRYSLPQILFPGSDPDNSDIQNVLEGLKSSLHELFGLAESPLLNMINSGKGQETDLRKAFIRLTSPGLKKKGGGQRVKQIRFYDNWDLMASGNAAIYGKTYDYTMPREDGKGTISSGVASYEPMTGGDEIPQRLPVSYTAQQSTHFPPNDPVDLYQEFPIGESFFPSPVVGYRRVTARSINIDKARSAQSEDISTFYTAKDFPAYWDASAINTPDNDRHVSLTEVTTTQQSTQGFSLVFNDMHGKPRTTEHWVLKPDTTVHAKELVNYQQYDYLTQNGQLSNMVPSFDYNPSQGKLQVVNKKMGIETDVTIDSRMTKSETNSKEVSANINGFVVGFFPIVVGLGYPFNLSDKTTFNCASVTKVTQQYGILSKVTSNNQGAITEVHNDVYDPQTGNVLVTSVNNQYGDREFTVNYPAYWAYREMGPSYENLDLMGRFADTVYVDSLGGEGFSGGKQGYGGNHFVNYNPAYSSHFSLPSNMPVARVRIDEEMPKFKVGDELLLYYAFPFMPIKFWVMGFTSDKDHCYLVMAPREPYKMEGFWAWGNKYTNLFYHNVRSGNRNRLGETIQSFTTTDSSDIYPYLKNDLTKLINLNATRYNHQAAQVYAANTTSDSLNPFTSGKVGIYRPERQIVNLTNRDYTSGINRSAGIFNSAAYWKTEIDPTVAYCPDSVVYRDYGQNNIYDCPNVINSFSLSYVYPDGMKVVFTPSGACPNPAPDFLFSGYMGNNVWPPYNTPAYQNYVSHFAFQGMNPGYFVYHDSLFLNNPANTDHRIMYYSNGCCSAAFQIDFNYQTHDFTITNLYFLDGSNNPIVVHGTYTDNNAYHLTSLPIVNGGTPTLQPYRVRKKIMLDKVGHYDGTDDENWVNAQHVTKYNWFGQELENLEEGIGYNSATYGYNQQLPTCVTKNARQGEVLYESFEDYALLRPVSSANESYKPLFYSPFEPYLQNFTSIDLFYKLCNMTATGSTFTLVSDDEHSGNYALKTAGTNVAIPLNGTGTGMANGYSFKMTGGKKYVASVWLKPTTVLGSSVISDYNGNVTIAMDTAINGAPAGVPITATLTATSPIIDGWQQYSATFDVAANRAYFTLNLGANFYYDDLRIFPFASNSKGFVYHPVTRKLMATLDENNYATFYEYDAEGNLVRTKKETSKGILTVSESRSTHYKSNKN